MSAKKNTLFNYFAKSPAPSPGGSPAVSTPKPAKPIDSPAGTPKRALASASRGGAQDSPKSTKSVRKEHLVAASPRTRVQRRLLEAASSSPSVFEPRFLRNVLTPQKENETVMSPVFKALKEHEELASETNPSSQDQSSSVQQSSPSSEEVVISPSKCSVRRPVRNLNKEFVMSPLKRPGENIPIEKKVKGPEDEVLPPGSMDANVAFGLYLAEEMRRLNCDKAVRSLKKKVMKAILDVQTEQENRK